MQSLASQSIATPYEPLIARWLVRTAQTLSVALREYVASWRQRPSLQRGELPARLRQDARLLRDIGAPDWMIDRAIAESQQRLQIFH